MPPDYNKQKKQEKLKKLYRAGRKLKNSIDDLVITPDGLAILRFIKFETFDTSSAKAAVSLIDEVGNLLSPIRDYPLIKIKKLE